jgi:hypothetical protein
MRRVTMGFYTNLLKETLEELKDNGYSESDVEWVGNSDYYFSFDHFKKIADVNYDSGYGAAEVASDLIIVGKDWWLEREEYDGAEGWKFKKKIVKPNINKEVDSVVGGMWCTLDEINELDEEE